MDMLKGLFRDVVLVATGLNIALIVMGIALDSVDLALLGGMSLALCGFGLAVSDMTKEDNDED